MLFNSHVFILAFLPLCYAVALILSRRSVPKLHLTWLLLSSFVFHAWGGVNMALLFWTSIACNCGLGWLLVRPQTRGRYGILVLGVIANLAFIGYFKYLGLLAETANSLLGTQWEVGHIVLPLGISFYTLQQIAYLVDAYRGEVAEHDPLKYSLFVAFFPHLIAGPITHHRDILSQFSSAAGYRLNSANFAVGITMFSIGLFKKVVLADNLAPLASAVFGQAQDGRILPWTAAWIGAVAYSLQLYFDFSGYSDMALGLGRMFSIRLPLNFNSPYKAVDIVDFWRRWHITLSHFLRDYLYIPLGGSRCGGWRRHINLMLVMLIGGLWHGASWTFVVWGGLHGLLLIVNHAWNAFLRRGGSSDEPLPEWRLELGRVTTFLAVTVAWVFFRSESLTTATSMLSAMFGGSGPSWIIEPLLGRQIRSAQAWIPLGLAVVWLLPNTQELMGRVRPTLNYSYRPDVSRWSGWLVAQMQWQPSRWVAFWYAGLFVVAFCSFSRLSEFIYFNF